jgi:glycosidase
VGWLNDYDYRNNPAKAGDSRWVHRPVINWEIMERRHDPDTIEGRIFMGLQNLIAVRKRTPAFSGNRLRSINTENAHVLGFLRQNGTDQVLVLANFSEREQRIAANQLRLYGLSYRFRELITGQVFELQDLVLDSYGFSCLEGIGQD